MHANMHLVARKDSECNAMLDGHDVADVRLLQVDVVHHGQLSLKGVLQPISVFMLIPSMLSGRMYPESLPGGKAKILSGPRGFQCSVTLPAGS